MPQFDFMPPSQIVTADFRRSTGSVKHKIQKLRGNYPSVSWAVNVDGVGCEVVADRSPFRVAVNAPAAASKVVITLPRDAAVTIESR